MRRKINAYISGAMLGDGKKARFFAAKSAGRASRLRKIRRSSLTGGARTQVMTKRKPASEWIIKRNRDQILEMYEQKVGILSIAVRLGVSAHMVRYVLDGRPDPITGEAIDYDSSSYMPESFSYPETDK